MTKGLAKVEQMGCASSQRVLTLNSNHRRRTPANKFTPDIVCVSDPNPEPHGTLLYQHVLLTCLCKVD
uniref:Uncharacterized protein n=1 Tax=Anguilla anguilla TaxID=7936 RepID=A0A0E9V6T6_ANGAN